MEPGVHPYLTGHGRDAVARRKQTLPSARFVAKVKGVRRAAVTGEIERVATACGLEAERRAHVAHHREPETVMVAVGAGRIAANEAVEHARQDFGGNGRTAVDHLDQRVAAAADPDGATLVGVSDGVGEEVADDEIEEVGVGVGLALDLVDERQAAAGSQKPATTVSLWPRRISRTIAS